MPKLDQTFDNAQESTAQEFRSMEPGAYMCRVQAVRTEWTDAAGKRWTSDDKNYVKLILDIAEGENEGRFSDDYWQGSDKDWGHTLFMSWTERALGMLKHTFSAFDEANAGFDARAAFEADRWEMFVGKLLLVAWSGQEYESNTGELRLRVRPDRALTGSDNMKAKVEKLDGTRVDYEEWLGGKTAQAASAPSDTYSDVPF